MNGFLLRDEGSKTFEDGVDMPDRGVEVEDRFEIDACLDARVGTDELAEVPLLVPGDHRVLLNEAIRVVAGETALHKGQEQPVAEDEPVARAEVPTHPLGVDDQSLDDPREAV